MVIHVGCHHHPCHQLESILGSREGEEFGLEITIVSTIVTIQKSNRIVPWPIFPCICLYIFIIYYMLFSCSVCFTLLVLVKTKSPNKVTLYIVYFEESYGFSSSHMQV